ncbi:AAA family ATPase [Gorillibacterium massiliense]|uniref:AAA family ATPase n=1 Tax=Gorillibacterium massiliense TaxID=1280390 RepID=UPI0004B5DCAA|nr:AAA family ATPase [Gorillibacterium massiliense]
MKLSRIYVKKLFGIFDHDIRINNEEGITIVIGENGLGKTVLLETIEAFFNRRFEYFNTINFNELCFEFNDNVTWKIKKVISDGEDFLSYNLQVSMGNEMCNIKLSISPQDNIHRTAQYVARKVGLKRVGYSMWEDRTGTILTSLDVMLKYAPDKYYRYNSISHNSEMHSSFDRVVFADDERFVPRSIQLSDIEPSWFRDRLNEVNVSIIETQRVFIVEGPDRAPVETVKKYANELRDEIKAKLTESTELSSKLDRTYPNRLIKEINRRRNRITDAEIGEKLTELEEKRNLLGKVGLIENENDTILFEVNKQQDIIKDVLKLYISDSFDKLSIFNDLADKIELFLKIINSRFKHKRLYVNKEVGFLFRSTVIKDDKKNFKVIPIDKLSSGEKNELILFYKLIFKTTSNSLILIDEPEISLHISWQNKFITDLNEIHKLNKQDILIATHSPDIISNDWDLAIELKGVE